MPWCSDICDSCRSYGNVTAWFTAARGRAKAKLLFHFDAISYLLILGRREGEVLWLPVKHINNILNLKEKSVKGTMVFRSPFCAPGACTPLLTPHSVPYAQGTADFSGQSTAPIHQPAQERGSAQVTEQSQGQLLAQPPRWAGSLGSGCRLKVRWVTSPGGLLEGVSRGASRSASEQEEQQNSWEVQ